jgi:hypothetical protein
MRRQMRLARRGGENSGDGDGDQTHRRERGDEDERRKPPSHRGEDAGDRAELHAVAPVRRGGGSECQVLMRDRVILSIILSITSATRIVGASWRGG